MFGRFLRITTITAVFSGNGSAMQCRPIPSGNVPSYRFRNTGNTHHWCKWFEAKRKLFDRKSYERKIFGRKPSDIGESRGGFSCERHSFDGERKVSLEKKPYEGKGTFGSKEHRSDHALGKKGSCCKK